MEKIKPIVTIITPLYHQAKYLSRCVDSVIEQTLKDWSMIIVCDGGGEEDELEAKKQANRDKRIKVISHSENMGLPQARNAGILASDGECIQFLDSDDWIDPHKLKKQLVKMTEDGAEISHTDFYHELPDKHVYGCTEFRHDAPLWEFMNRWENGLCIAVHSFLFKKKVFDEVGLFDKTLRGREDWDFHLRCAKKNYTYSYLPEPLAHYRIHQESMCRTTALTDKNEILRKNGLL